MRPQEYCIHQSVSRPNASARELNGLAILALGVVIVLSSCRSDSETSISGNGKSEPQNYDPTGSVDLPKLGVEGRNGESSDSDKRAFIKRIADGFQIRQGMTRDELSNAIHAPNTRQSDFPVATPTWDLRSQKKIVGMEVEVMLIIGSEWSLWYALKWDKDVVSEVQVAYGYPGVRSEYVYHYYPTKDSTAVSEISTQDDLFLQFDEALYDFGAY